jgi:hypothetical protein
MKPHCSTKSYLPPPQPYSPPAFCTFFLVGLMLGVLERKIQRAIPRIALTITNLATLVLSQYGIDGPYLYQDRPLTKVTGYIYKVHLRGLLLINVIATPSTSLRIHFTEGSRLSLGPESRRRGVAYAEKSRPFSTSTLISS